MFDAISQDRPERIGPLIAEGANSNAYHERLYDEWRPMHHAALDGRTDCIRALLEAGVSPDAIDQYFSTPLHHAAGQGHPDCVALLLNAGADVNDRRSEFGDKTDDICGVHLPFDIRCSGDYDPGVFIFK